MAAKKVGAKPQFTPAVAKARAAESTRRSVTARQKALVDLAAMYPEDFETLRVKYRRKIDRTLGELPTVAPRGRKPKGSK